ncbi:two-component system, chemotaxis family, sensor kinase CheA [Sphingomonas gellani]|uniref:Chemotaxis protein CheA n=1 Tax=Sphingomonas gellani TaxID=1166340 RepID=A0A1H7YCM2_9SPHN|nr:Hpt domain-containing protein [Sphingomonas gellani]SEM43962.1 two-component system, chemotaxis family, sensor kinase CheA [Sphingomonas gellani]
MDDLLQEFVAETRETLEALAGEIVAWEAQPTDGARLDAIFRFVHTVKGSCGFLDLPRLSRLSHAAEDVLAAVREGTRAPDTALVNAVLAIVDRIGEIVEAIDAGVPLDDSSEDLLVAALAEDARPVSHNLTNTGHRAPARSVRLSVDLLDRMMSGMSDMVLARNELARRLRDEGSDPRVEAALERLSVTVAEMRDAVTRTRMQKIEALFSALPRMVRDTAAELGKTVALTLEGSDVELDREMIEMMRDPLVHIIRNAIDHGIEMPAARGRAGKREMGRLTVSARQSGNQILVEIADDGQGVDVPRLVAKAVERGVCTSADAERMNDAARLALIFTPGLSSRDSVTSVSGRGVGMDVVRANVEQIGGRIALSNRAGQGLAITIQVPLTLSIMPTIVIGCGDQRFALPRASIDEIVTLRGETVRIDTVGDAAVATVRGTRLPLVTLAPLLGLTGGAARTLAIVGTRDGSYALAIDTVLDTEELVIKPAAPAVMATGVYAGQSLPDSGLPMLLLDGAGIAAVAGLHFDRGIMADEVQPEALADQQVPALLFDDLDGQRRAMALAAIDRVETVPVGAIRRAGGCLRLTVDGAVLPIRLVGDLAGRDELPVLRLTDGSSEIAYGIAEPLDIVALPTEIAPARGDGLVAGVVLIEGEQVELLDPLALFADAESVSAEPALCLLRDDDAGWMNVFLRPVLEMAGYRCVSRIEDGCRPAVTLTMAAGDAGAPADDAVPVVRLRRERTAPLGTDPSIYRYDKDALLSALAHAVAARRAG